MPTLQVQGVEIYYEEEGAGTPLLLIPGLAADAAIWQPVRRKLSKYFRLLMPDPPGSARSGDCPAGYTLSNFAQLWLSFLSALGIDRAHILGQSMGGMVAQMIALQAPARVDHLILMSTTSHTSARTAQIIRRWEQLKGSGDADAFFADVLMWLVPPAYYNDDDLRTTVLRYMIEYPYPQSAENFSRQAAALYEADLSAQLAQLQMPVLIVSGADDMLFTPRMQQDFAARIPQARLTIVPDTGHSLLLGRTAPFIDAVLAFLQA